MARNAYCAINNRVISKQALLITHYLPRMSVTWH